MYTGASNLHHLATYLSKEDYRRICKAKAFSKRLWRCSFDEITQQDFFLKQLTSLIQEDLIILEHIPVYHLAVWHKTNIDKEGVSFSIEDIKFATTALSYIKKTSFFWDTLIKLLLLYPKERVIYILKKTHAIISLYSLFQSNTEQIESILLILDKNIHQGNPIKLKACCEVIRRVDNPLFVIPVLEGFLDCSLFLFLQKTKAYKIPHLELLLSWMELYVGHQLPECLLKPELNIGIPLSKIPFAEVIRNTPSVFLQYLHLLTEQDKAVFTHLALGNNIRSLDPFQHMSNAMAHELVTLQAEAFDLIKEVHQIHLSNLLYFKYTLAYIKLKGWTKAEIHRFCSFFHFPSGDFSKAKMDELESYSIIFDKLKIWFENPSIEPEIDAYEVLGYIQHCRYEGIEFDISKRTLKSITRLVGNWRREQLIAAEKYRSWIGAPFNNWHYKTKHTLFEIIQLTDSNQLVDESIQMKHCVSSYAKACKKGKCSIWSLRKTDKNGTTPLVTIEINKKNKIAQLKAKYNMLPTLKHVKLIQSWATSEGIKIKKRVIAETEELVEA